MNFLSPYWLYCLVLVPIFVVMAILVKRSNTRAWQKLVAPRLQAKLVKKAPTQQHWTGFAFALLAFTLTVIAMARPYQGEETTLEKIKSRNILIAIDTSRSMLCQDTSSNRLTAAKSLSLQMLGSFPTDRIGVLAFAGSSNVIAPLTIDHLAVHDTIAQLDTESLARRGSNLAEAVSHGVETLKATGKRANALVIFSDGEEHDSGIDKAIAEANEAGVQIITIGVGSQTGGIIPSSENSDGKHRNHKGEVVHTRLHESLLSKLASETNGAYTAINNSPEAVIKASLEKMDSFEQDGRAQVIPQECYQWFLAAAAAAAILSALIRAGWRNRAGVPLLLLSISLLSAPQSEASESWFGQKKHALFTKPEAKRKAYQALKNAQYDEAITQFEIASKHSSGEELAQLSMGLGQALYRSEEYDRAAKSFTKALLSKEKQTQANAQYNLGNAIYKQASKAFEGIGDKPLKEFLLSKAQAESEEEKLDDTALEALEKSFSSALEKYSSSEKLAPRSQTLENIKNSQAVVNTIKQVREELKKQQQQQDKEDKEDKEGKEGKEPQKKEDEQKDQSQKNKDSQKDEDGQNNKDEQEGEENKEQQDGEDSKESEDGKNSQEGQEGDQQEQDAKGDQDGEDSEEDNDGQQSQESDSEKDDGEPSQNGSLSDKEAKQQALAQQAASAEMLENGYNLNQQEARKLLEKHADMQKRPVQRRANPWKQQINKHIDW